MSASPGILLLVLGRDRSERSRSIRKVAGTALLGWQAGTVVDVSMWQRCSSKSGSLRPILSIRRWMVSADFGPIVDGKRSGRYWRANRRFGALVSSFAFSPFCDAALTVLTEAHSTSLRLAPVVF